ncbi:MAG TPA: hypothetical protein VGG56_11965 [Terracidiphilus sp.]|jgi:hypothetical protein
MPKIASVAGLCSILLLAPASGSAAPAAAKPASGSLVIVFNDGHRQSYNLADIERIEFPSGDASLSQSTSSPSRGHFLGKWEVGEGNGDTFYITLEESGNAMRSLGDVHGKWTYLHGEAQIRWDDGAQDAIRRVGSHFQKFAYSSGKLFTDVPDNVTNARNTTPKPI